jgi:hypothetical protein
MMYVLIPILSALLPMALVVAAVFLFRLWQKRDGRRSPLRDKLHNGPGEQLRQDLEKSGDALDEALMTFALLGPFLLCAWAVQQLDWSKVRFGISEWILTIFFLAVLAWTLRRTLRLVARRQRLREGLAAELMTAQSLLPLASKGCQVFHDIPAEKFNLDHVVIGTHAVYMVETKSRKKPAGKGKESARVEYDGKLLRFPDHATDKPLEQARHEARWLAEFLRGAAGEAVPVVPVVALPGWFVSTGKDAHRSDVIVLNPKYHAPFLDRRNGAPLNESLRNRVAYALMQRYPELG